jgi:hypothetical protein
VLINLILPRKPYKRSTHGQGELDGLDCSTNDIEGKKHCKNFVGKPEGKKRL